MRKKFYSKAEAEAYLRSQGDNTVLSDESFDWDAKGKAIYGKCADIPGCEVGMVWIIGIVRPIHFIKWKGTEMHFLSIYREKTFKLQLVDGLETYGYSIDEYFKDDDRPNNIGSPTAKKLDEWREYLLNTRKTNDERVEKIVSEAESKKAACKAMFPDGKVTEHEPDGAHWKFEYTQAGLTYICKVHSSGHVNEEIKLAWEWGSKDDDKLIKAFLMMQNPYTPLKKQSA